MNNSPQWRDGLFHNSLTRHDASIWTMLVQNFTNKAKHKTPLEPIETLPRKAEEFTIPPDSGLRVTWLGHSSVLIEIDGYKVLTDPVWGERTSPFSFLGPKRFFAPPMPMEQLPRLDAVIISHDHYDHLDKSTIQALKDRVPLFVVPLGVSAYLEKWGVEPERIRESDWWGEVELGELTLTATPARHFSGRSLVMADQNKTLWCGWVIAGSRHRVYYSGDTAMFPGFTDIGERLGPFDLTLIESGAYSALWKDVHIGPEQAVQAHRMVRGQLMMPVHWGTFDLAMHNWTEPAERIIAASQEAQVNVVIPRPGESFEPATPPTLTRWWPDLPWQSADEAPVISSGLKPELTQLGRQEEGVVEGVY